MLENIRAVCFKSSMSMLMAGFFLLIYSCSDSQKQKSPPKEPEKPVFVPTFEADSAYEHIKTQLSYGPRVPNTGAHINCGQWLEEYLQQQGAKITSQTALLTAYNGDQLSTRNIIAEFNPQAQARVMLSAHWDTRPIGEQDPVDKDTPIPGANDGASGVAVLLEIARNLKSRPPNIGVDIFLWDAEDYGNPGTVDSYCLGTQYWAKNPHRLNYKPLYGINLDMVGAEGAQFYKEEVSMNYAPTIIEKVWLSAHRSGYGQYFSHIRSNPVTDDHVYINTMAKIPCINIIDQRNGSQFFDQWHTLQDDLSIISKNTLKAVGQTVLEVVYRE